MPGCRRSPHPRQHPGNQRHLGAVDVLRMGAAHAVPEILQLPRHVPVAHALQAWARWSPRSPPVGAMAGGAGRVALPALVQITLDRRRYRRVRQARDIGDDIVDRGVVGQRRGHRRHHLAEHVLLVRAAGSVLEVASAAAPGTSRPGRSVSVHSARRCPRRWRHGRPCTPRTRPGRPRRRRQAGRASAQRSAAGRARSGRRRSSTTKPAAHREVPDAAEFLAQQVERPRARGREPDVRDEARHHVHLDADLRHREVVQHVLGAQQHLDRLAERQMQFGIGQQTSSRPLGSSGSMPKGLSALTKRESTVPSLPSLPGRRYLQFHCWATTSTIGASFGT